MNIIIENVSLPKKDWVHVLVLRDDGRCIDEFGNVHKTVQVDEEPKSKYLLQIEPSDGGWDYTLYKWMHPLPGLNADGVYEELDGGRLDEDHSYQYNEAIREIRLFHDIKDTDEVNVIKMY